MKVKKKYNAYLYVESKYNERLVEVYLKTKSKPKLRKVRLDEDSVQLNNIFGEQLIRVRLF